MKTTTSRLLIVAGVAALAAAACSHQSSSSRPSPADSVQIGYGAQPKGKVTGAVTSLSDNEITARPLRIEQLLRGRVPGLEVISNGNAVTFRIRGAGSLLNDQEPLVIVDGVMIQSGNILNALAGLTPDDIRRVDVLKDIASTSIYGGRGAGGVIVITTRLKSPPEGSS